MPRELQKAQVMFKLTRKNNWGNSYDRLEHFKRFPDLDNLIEELIHKEWIIPHKKPKYLGISLNPKYKKQIIEFIETKMPYLKDIDWVK